MDGHRAFIVGYEYSVLTRCNFQDLVVWQTFEPGIVRALEIDRRLAMPNAWNDYLIQIGIRQESDAHDLGFRNPSLSC